jgi:hypothetical protein
MTCGLLGLVILSALFGRGKRREVAVGAALFGAGYMLLAFGRSPYDSFSLQPTLPTEHLLNAIRPWFPLVPNSILASNARILEALDQPIPMRFPNETPIEDVLKYIKKATTTPTYPGIPIYVDPLGLTEAERTLNSPVTIDLEGVPLKTTLRLCLKQLGLDYHVEDGFLRITSKEEGPSVLEDPFLIVGHCLLALIAAALGGVAAPLVSDARRGPPPRAAVEDRPVAA